MKQTASESGIQLLSAPHMSTSPPGKQRSMIYTMLLALLGISSTFAVFLSMFDLQVNYSMLIGGILLVPFLIVKVIGILLVRSDLRIERRKKPPEPPDEFPSLYEWLNSKAAGKDP